MSRFSSKGIRFSGDSIKSCVGFIDLADSTKNTNRYSTYNIRKTNNYAMSITKNNKKDFLTKKQLSSFKENGKRFFFHKKNGAKRIILIDDEQDLLFTSRMLRAYNYNITSFTDPSIALNYIRDLIDFNGILVVLDIQRKNLNGIQLHQQIKAIDPTIKIIFIKALDILDDLSSIVPGIPKEQIMRKPIDKKIIYKYCKQIIKLIKTIFMFILFIHIKYTI